MLARGSLAKQVREDLRAQILDGRLASGSQLPAEVELARTLGVSRTSLREAVQQLEQDGLLIRRHGYGTFVRSSRMLHSSLNLNLSATELIRAQGMEPGTRDPTVRRDTATAHEAEQLGLPVGSSVIVLERIRTADGRPVVFTRDVMPPTLLSSAGVDPEELVNENLSLYRFFGERLGVSVIDGTALIRPEIATAALAARLGIAVGTPTFVIEQVDRDAAERRLLLTWEHYVADAFEFVIYRRGPAFAAQASPATAATRSDERAPGLPHRGSIAVAGAAGRPSNG